MAVARDLIHGEWRSKMRPEALIFAGRDLLKGWTVMDRLGEITVPTLVMAGRDDFMFPPEYQRELAAGIPDARLQIIDHAGHNPHAERPAEVMAAVRDFISADAPTRLTARRPPRPSAMFGSGFLREVADEGKKTCGRSRGGPFPGLA